jgi:hypothetical protein
VNLPHSLTFCISQKTGLYDKYKLGTHLVPELESQKFDMAGRGIHELLANVGEELTLLQQPSDLITLMSYSISLLPAIRLGIEGKIFRTLAASSETVTLKQLAANVPHTPIATEEDAYQREEFVSRILSACAAMRLLDEAAPFVYQTNDMTRTMSESGYEDGWIFMYDNIAGPQSTYSNMLTWVREHGFRAPVDATQGAFQMARGITGTSTFAHWEKKDPASLMQLSTWMKAQQQNRLNWSAWFPAEELFSEKREKGSERVFLIDVGGGLGHDLHAFAQRYKDRKNMKLVLHDLPEVIAEAKGQNLDARISVQEQNFFAPNAVKGANIVSLTRISVCQKAGQHL